MTSPITAIQLFQTEKLDTIEAEKTLTPITTKTQTISKSLLPITGVVYRDATENLSLRNACKEGGSIPVQCNYEVEGVIPSQLEAEVDMILATSDRSQSRPLQIVTAAAKVTAIGDFIYPQLHMMQTYAETVAKEYDAILLPGGLSIPPKFYGEDFADGEERHGYSSDPRRTILEFFLIRESARTDKPILGICRGHQALNIYYGGTLDRCSIGDIQQHKIRSIAPFAGSSKPSYLGTIPKIAYFHHKQTVVRIGEGLRSMAKVEALKDLPLEKENLQNELACMSDLIEPGDPQLAFLENSIKEQLEAKKYIENIIIGGSEVR